MSEEQPWLSILLPVFKVEAFLPACAASILAQDCAGVELVFVDDASPDASAQILAQLQASHPQTVRIIRHPHNQGISAARNSALDAARGRYLWFIDSDDLLEPGAMAALKAVVDSHDPDLVMCDFRAFDEQANPQRISRPRYAHVSTFEGPGRQLSQDSSALISGLFKAGQLHFWSKIVKRSVWPDGLRCPVGRSFEDLAVAPRLALQVASHIHIPEVWIAYRQRPGSILSNLDAAKIEDWSSAMCGLGRDMQAAGLGEDEQTRFEVAHFCARTFVRVCKRFGKLGGPSQDPAALSRYAAHWRDAAPLSAGQLMLAYLRRGRFLRALQFGYWLRRAGG